MKRVVNSVPPPPPPWRSSYILGIGTAVILAIFLGTYSCDGGRSRLTELGPGLCSAVHEWRDKYGTADDLRVIATRVAFHGIPGNFAPGDAVVVAPVALNLAGAQEVLDVKGNPAPLRVLNAEGTSNLSWEYPGGLMKDLTFEGLALVRRGMERSVSVPDGPTFGTLADDLKIDSVLSGAALEDRHVSECKAFAEWARRTGGDGPYTSQLLRLAQHVGSHLYEPDPEKDRRRLDDACTGIREDRFTKHQAQVLTVMAAREIGAPAIGLMGSDPEHRFLVATYLDGVGWIHIDLTSTGQGFRAGGEGLIAKAPLIGRFEAALEEGWNSAGAAYKKSQFGNQPLSYTQTVSEEAPDKDTTTSWSKPLKELCP